MAEAPNHGSPETCLARYRANGDPEAFGRLFDQTAPVLHRLALSLLPTADAADDAVQAAYLALIEHLDRHDPTRLVLPWLVGILRIEVLRIRRTFARRPDTARVGSEFPDTLVEPELPDVPEIHAAIEGLTEPYRSVGLLRWRYGLSPAEIGHVRGEPAGTTRSVLSRALARLRRVLRGGVLAVLPRARGLEGVRRAVLKRAGHHLPGPTAAIIGGTLVTKLAFPIGGLVLLIALATTTVVLLTSSRDGDPQQLADSREVGHRVQPAVVSETLLRGRVAEPTPTPAPAGPSDSGGKPTESKSEATPTPLPEELWRERDARKDLDALLGALEAVDRLYGGEGRIRLAAIDMERNWTRGELGAETTALLDAGLRALREDARVPTRHFQQRDFPGRDGWRFAAFEYRPNAPSEGGTWETTESLPLEDISTAIQSPGGRRVEIKAERRDRGLASRVCDISVVDVSEARRVIAALDALSGVRITKVAWREPEPGKPLSVVVKVTARLKQPDAALR